MQIYAEHTPLLSKISYAMKWNGKSLQVSKYCDSVGNVKLDFDISESFLRNWSLHESFESRISILILNSNKHWNIWIIHGMKTNFGHLFPNLFGHWMSFNELHNFPWDVFEIFVIISLTWAWWTWKISLTLYWSATMLSKAGTFCFLSSRQAY